MIRNRNRSTQAPNRRGICRVAPGVTRRVVRPATYHGTPVDPSIPVVRPISAAGHGHRMKRRVGRVPVAVRVLVDVLVHRRAVAVRRDRRAWRGRNSR